MIQIQDKKLIKNIPEHKNRFSNVMRNQDKKLMVKVIPVAKNANKNIKTNEVMKLKQTQQQDH